jgi:hypothetical protein
MSLYVQLPAPGVVGSLCMYSYQPEGWLDPHTVLAPDTHTHTHMHTQAHTHKYTYSTPNKQKTRILKNNNSYIKTTACIIQSCLQNYKYVKKI